MTTSQILKSIAHKLSLTFRVPSSESQKLEAINKALPRFTTDPPYVADLAYTADTEDTVVLTYSEPVELLAGATPERWELLAVASDGSTGSEQATAAEQTGESEITLTFPAATGTTNIVHLNLDSFAPAVCSVATLTPERVAGEHRTVWAGLV